MLGKVKVISIKKEKMNENLIIRLESEDEFSTEEVNNLINYLTDAANLLMLYKINEFIEVSDNFNNELKILSERIINKRIDLFQNILNGFCDLKHYLSNFLIFQFRYLLIYMLVLFY